MKTKIPNTDFPNKKLLEGRDQYQKLSPTNASGKGDQTMGIIGLIIFSGILIWMIMDVPLTLGTLPIFILLGIMILLFRTLIYYSGKEKITLEDAHYFDPRGKAQFRIINLIQGIIIFTSFLFCFFFIMSGGGKVKIMVVIGTIVIALVYSAFIYEANKIYKLRHQAKKFGPSKLTILKPSTIYLGDNIELQLYNKFLPKHLSHVNIMLRNIQEAWEWRYKRKRNKNESKILRTYILFEENQRIHVESNTLNFNFDLPTSEVAPTDHTSTKPFYWELEISNKKENYHCIFYIEVNS